MTSLLLALTTATITTLRVKTWNSERENFPYVIWNNIQNARVRSWRATAIFKHNNRAVCMLLWFSFESKQPWPTLCTRCELGDQSGRDFSVRLSAAQLLKRNKKTTELLGPKVTTNIDSFISNQEIFQGCKFDVIGWKENCTAIASDI